MQAAQLHARLIERGGAFVPDQGVVGDAAVEGRRQLDGQGLGVRQRQQARPLPFRVGHGDGLARRLRLAQHFPQRPEGLGVRLRRAAPRFHGVQQAAYVRKGGKMETTFGKGAFHPGRRLLIEAGGLRGRFGVGQRGETPGAFASGGGTAQSGQPGRDFAEIQRMEGAGVYHAKWGRGD